MKLVCLDLEGVLVPEIWINFAIDTGIDELKKTTRDEPDYDKLMNYRIDILDKNGLKLSDIQRVISGMDPLPGAKDFMEELRSKTQVVILSDTFDQFAQPLMKKLDWPTLFCNTLNIKDDGSIGGYRLRQQDGKRKAVEGFHSMGLKVVCSGDSYNDLSMIRKADAGVLFTPPENIVKDNPDLPVAVNYTELMAELDAALARI
ncbi:MAG: bifunctional phosphoserine phosphatase/homoserine phosphotransferase ThrH [Spirochaetales bacterium]|uniref:phosphoserine phosphatase n=1 Tax=Candidatus Thalassospirochaeta sargassi TaxID=3119039 RepID=A0AAJ1IAN9_9SPIO|nr:bifunctional phosphoserine phosphatase/homoserine phosphotransferase ThrH [Spirochaetales bacterium]